MKKSEAYHLAQIAVVNSPNITPEGKLDILTILIDDERLAVYCEEYEAQKAVKE